MPVLTYIRDPQPPAVFFILSAELYDAEESQMAGLAATHLIPAKSETFYLPWTMPYLPSVGDLVAVGPDPIFTFVTDVEWWPSGQPAPLVLLRGEPEKTGNYDDYMDICRALEAEGAIPQAQWYERGK